MMQDDGLFIVLAGLVVFWIIFAIEFLICAKKISLHVSLQLLALN